jgi:chemotaxis protein MotB
VAYADFVTAMMAFFLLLWLLASTSEGQKKSIADYFTPTVGLKDEMGIGFEGGISPMEEDTNKSELMPPGLIPGQVEQGPTPEAPKEALIESTNDGKLFEKAEQEMKQAIESDPNLREFTDNIRMEQTPEGLKLQMLDDDKHPMFLPGSIHLSDFGQKILSGMTPIIKKMPNLISIIGHTDATPLGKLTYSNWELSADRANTARRFLVGQGLHEKRIGKITGRADAELLMPEVPSSPRNRRIEIILLKGAHMTQATSVLPAPRSLLSIPKAGDTLRKMQQSNEKQKIQTIKKPAAAGKTAPASPAFSMPPAATTQKSQ